MTIAASRGVGPAAVACILSFLALAGCAPPKWRAVVTNTSGQTLQVDLSQGRMRLAPGQSLDLADAQLKRLKAGSDGAPALRVQRPDGSATCYAMVFTSIPEEFVGKGHAVHVAITADGRAVAVRPSAKSASEMTGQEPALGQAACP